MSRDSESPYFDMLCEQEQVLQENHRQLQCVIGLLKDLANPETPEADQILLLQSLSKKYKDLISSSVDLRFIKYQTRESQISALKRTRRNINPSKLQTIEDLGEYVTLHETVGRESLEYVNLLERLSVDLAKQIEIADPAVTEFVVDNWNPPKGIFAILEELENPDTDAADLRSRLSRYLDQIKMERAKYTIQNKYSLQETLSSLNKEVNDWRKEWDAIENLMFGDSSHSMKKMLQNIELLKSKVESQMTSEEVSVNM